MATGTGLAHLRSARSMSQQAVADALGVSRARVAAIEKQADLHVSTLRDYVEALGGRLEVAAVFPRGQPRRLVVDHGSAERHTATKTAPPLNRAAGPSGGDVA